MEFRLMDNPILNKEKAAFTYFLVLFDRMIKDEKLGLNFYIPISLVDKNMDEAKKINAFSTRKFYHRKYFCKHFHGSLTK